jgi:hypothetical protein
MNARSTTAHATINHARSVFETMGTHATGQGDSLQVAKVHAFDDVVQHLAGHVHVLA